MTDRRVVMARVRAALASLERRVDLPTYADEATFTRAAMDREDLAGAFARELEDAGGRAFRDIGSLGQWLVNRDMRRGYCDPTFAAGIRAAFPAEIEIETTFSRSRIDRYDFALTRAAGAIAETGTLILTDETTPYRLAALAPWTHIAVLLESTIHARVVDALRALGSDPNVIWCTGPSKTADVEGILVEGVHGPGEEVALLVADNGRDRETLWKLARS